LRRAPLTTRAARSQEGARRRVESYAESSTASPYELLGVNSKASAEEIRHAYQQLARTVHPDRGGGDEVFVRVQRAYDTLREPEARRRFDAEARAVELAEAAHAARVFEVEMEDLHYEEEEEEEEPAEGTAEDSEMGGARRIVGVWRCDCRCGDGFELSAEQLAAGEAVPCRSCSLVLQLPCLPAVLRTHGGVAGAAKGVAGCG
jgi:diphthamide biosynthesis protein 4